ncbi:vacuole membrane protein KMS1-like [Rosa chinensis]|uniref:vacuole membrane protein KMS1-like n=1 Tax=Rosa chinensis TaxID=74649 RepID=UPI001AD8B1F4|nr:vacuole membrane protein KMS1-like [Rosa chinensis]XP_040367662.1 vacuole membrane protein KMS1-like [Rosa chinensis]
MIIWAAVRYTLPAFLFLIYGNWWFICAVIMLAGGIGISTMIIGGPHEKHMQELIRYLQFGLWWLALGVTSNCSSYAACPDQVWEVPLPRS